MDETYSVRLIDHLATQPLGEPGIHKRLGIDISAQTAALRERILTTRHIFTIDNVAEYFMNGTDQEFWNIARDFPNLAPPFPVMWMEFRWPKLIRSREHGNTVFDTSVSRGAGVLIESFDLEDRIPLFAKPLPAETIEVMRAQGIRWWQVLTAVIQGGAKVDNEIVWTVPLASWCVTDKGRATMPDKTGTLKVGGEGNPMLIYPELDASWIPKEIATDTPMMFHIACLALSFLHCKNIRTEATTPPAALSKARTRRHGAPPLRPYKTLVIEPLKRILHTEGRAGSVGLAKALHICRGHFKDYTEHGLFGRYHGVYWWEDRVKETTEKRRYAVKV